MNSNLNFNQYQDKARKLAIYSSDYKILYPALGLAGETGKVCEKIKKLICDDDFDIHAFTLTYFCDDMPKEWIDKQQEIKKELGDVLWYLANLASDFGLNLQDIAEANIEKLTDRKNRGKLQGEGDNR